MITILAIGLTHRGDVTAIAAGPVGGCAICGGASRVDYLGREVDYRFVGLAGRDHGDGRVKLVKKHGIWKK